MLQLGTFKKIGDKEILCIKNQEVAGCPGLKDKRDFIFFRVYTPFKTKTSIRSRYRIPAAVSPALDRDNVPLVSA